MSRSTSGGASDTETRGVDQLPSGHWRFRRMYKGKVLGGTFATLAEAIKTRDEVLRRLADETFVPSDGTSIRDLGPRFLRSRQGNRNHRTDRRRWDLHVAQADLARRPAGAVVRRDIVDWLEVLRSTQTAYTNRPNKTLSWQTRKHLLNLLRQFYRWAQDHGYVDANPALGVRVQRDDRDLDDGFQEGWYLDVAEQREVLKAAGDDPERHLIAFAMGTGLRLGELLCLHRDDVHLDVPQPYVDVRRGSWDAKAERFLPPKGRRGEKHSRRVPLFGMALDATRQWSRLLPSIVPKNPHGLMFPTRRGALRTKAPKVWATVKETFGVRDRIGREVWWHLLRHTFASSMIAGWWGSKRSLDEVRALMGHSSVKVTERYAHLADQTVHDIGTEMQAGWSSRHAVVTTPKIPRETPQGTRPSKPRVSGSSPLGRAQAGGLHTPEWARVVASRRSRGGWLGTSPLGRARMGLRGESRLHEARSCRDRGDRCGGLGVELRGFRPHRRYDGLGREHRFGR
jgi:site-specific recombinase XerD